MTIYLVNSNSRYCIYSHVSMTKFNRSTPSEAFFDFSSNIDTFNPEGLFHLDLCTQTIRYTSNNAYFGSIEYSTEY